MMKIFTHITYTFNIFSIKRMYYMLYKKFNMKLGKIRLRHYLFILVIFLILKNINYFKFINRKKLNPDE